MCTGWSYDYVGEEMDLIRVRSMFDYHKRNPPIHIMVARYLKFGEMPEQVKVPTEADLEMLMQQLPQSPGRP